MKLKSKKIHQQQDGINVNARWSIVNGFGEFFVNFSVSIAHTHPFDRCIVFVLFGYPSFTFHQLGHYLAFTVPTFWSVKSDSFSSKMEVHLVSSSQLYHVKLLRNDEILVNIAITKKKES